MNMLHSHAGRDICYYISLIVVYSDLKQEHLHWGHKVQYMLMPRLLQFCSNQKIIFEGMEPHTHLSSSEVHTHERKSKKKGS